MTESARPPRPGDLSLDRTRFWNGELWGYQPLWLLPDQVLDAVRQRFGSDVRTADFLGDGCMNQSWLVGGNREAAYVLRVSRRELSREQIAYEHAFSAALREHLDVVVAPLPGVDGSTIQTYDGWTLTLSPYVEGVLGTKVDPVVRNREAATVLAKLHRISLDELDLGQRPGQSMVEESPRWPWHEVAPTLRRELAGDRRFGELAAVIDAEVAELDAWLDELDANGRLAPRATVHGDFNSRNLVFRDDRLVAVIDFDNCRYDSIANELPQICASGDDVDPRATWQRYLDAGGPLRPDDYELIDGFARIGCLSEVQWSVDDDRIHPQVNDLLGEVVNGVRWLREHAPPALG